ncbi:universal stress protein [Mangrovicoccus ximenensis]|uniref:universal stress protein n=1 Tax=Mangrovicoccus ximenensis TaxID=1911570 RepID=UPI0038B29A22
MRSCPAPVWILNVAAGARARRILAAVDPDPDNPERDALNREIMEQATSLAVRDGAWLDVMNVWQLPEEHTLRRARACVPEDEIEALLRSTEQRSNWRLQQLAAEFSGRCSMMRVIHLKGKPCETILEHVETDGIDTIVMGTCARTGVAGFLLGNTAETVVKQVPCSVLTVKSGNFVPPAAVHGDMECQSDR